MCTHGFCLNRKKDWRRKKSAHTQLNKENELTAMEEFKSRAEFDRKRTNEHKMNERLY